MNAALLLLLLLDGDGESATGELVGTWANVSTLEANNEIYSYEVSNPQTVLSVASEKTILEARNGDVEHY